MRRYRLPYVGKSPVFPVRMHTLASDDTCGFEKCLVRKLRRLTPEQQEELHELLVLHQTDALTDGTVTYTMHNGGLWLADFSSYADETSQEFSELQTEMEDDLSSVY